MKVVVVGCGAVGQVYGIHLRDGGAEVVFLVPGYQVERLRAKPLRLYRLSVLRHHSSALGLPSSWLRRLLAGRALFAPSAKPRLFSDFHVLDLPGVADAATAGSSGLKSNERAKLAGVDAVIITIPSNRLRETEGAWLTDLIQHLEAIDPSRKGTIRVVNFAPSANDMDFLMKKIPKDLLLKGSISILAYQAPLPGQKFDSIPQSAYMVGDDGGIQNPVVAYTALSTQPISYVTPKSRQFADDLCATFSKGGLAARRVPLALQRWTLSVLGPLMTPLLLALEIKGWEFDGLAGDWALLRTVASAVHEAMQVKLHPPISWARHLVTSIHLYLVLKLLPLVFRPLCDIEAFVKCHFTKVGMQTMTHALDLMEEGRTKCLSMKSFGMLCHTVEQKRL